MGMFEKSAAKLHETTGIDPEYTRSGMLILPPAREELATSWCSEHRVGIEHVFLEDCIPGLKGKGLLMPEIAQVRNPRLLQAMRRGIENMGGTILEQQEVLHFEMQQNRISALATSKGKLSAGGYIVTAGAWSRILLGGHAMGLKVKPVRGQMLLFKFDAPPFSKILLQESLYLIPRRDGHVLAGSTLEDAGFDKSITEEAHECILQRVHALFPDWQPVRQWAGLRPGSPGNIPTIGRHPNIANLYANSGHFRYGVTMCFASAEFLLASIEDRAESAYSWQP
jgi:glycine oxidase